MFYVWRPLWPDLDLEPSLNIKHLLNQRLALYFRSTRGKFWPKTDNFEVSMARNLKAPILTFDLTLTWHVTSFGKFRGCFRIVSSRAFERRIVRLSAAIRSRVMTWGRLTPPPASRGWRSTPANAGLTGELEGGLRITPSGGGGGGHIMPHHRSQLLWELTRRILGAI